MFLNLTNSDKESVGPPSHDTDVKDTHFVIDCIQS